MERKNGVVEELEATANIQLDAGDAVVIETPGAVGMVA